jgi:Flp pilus assembly protein TadB
MKFVLIVVVVVILLAVTAPLNEAALRRIEERQSELSTQALAQAEALQGAAVDLNSLTNEGNLTIEAQRRVRAEAVGSVLFWLALFGALAVFLIAVAVVFVNMLLGNEWRVYMSARRQSNQLQAEYEDLRAKILKARQPPQPPQPPAQPPAAPPSTGGNLDTHVSSGRRRQS